MYFFRYAVVVMEDAPVGKSIYTFEVTDKDDLGPLNFTVDNEHFHVDGNGKQLSFWAFFTFSSVSFFVAKAEQQSLAFL